MPRRTGLAAQSLLVLLAALLCLGTARAQQRYDAIVDSHVRCLLGGSSAGAWLSDDDLAPKLEGGERYRIFTAKGAAGETLGGKTGSAGGACQGTLAVPFAPQPGVKADFLAITGNWNPAPRPVRNISEAKGRYQSLFGQFLASKGVKQPAQIHQLFRVDLDGDGKDEVVAVVQNFSLGEETPKVSRYSMVAVRRIVGQRVETFPLELEVEPREGGVSDFHIPFILDLNGDGILDIVVYGRYLQGIFTTVYSLDKGKFRKVLSCSCGG